METMKQIEKLVNELSAGRKKEMLDKLNNVLSDIDDLKNSVLDIMKTIEPEYKTGVKRFTEEEKNTIIRLRKEGTPLEEIADLLHRDKKTIETKVKQFNLVYTQKETEEIISLLKKGKTIDQVAEETKRNKLSILRHLKKIGYEGEIIVEEKPKKGRYNKVEKTK